MPDTSTSPLQVAAPGFAQRALFACIRAYQVLLSPIFGRQCRFYPSCSHYALEAIARHGACKGVLLSAGRIARCNPLCEGGHDPVPQRFL
jgi:putative membrane protein insertion efficiency factor